MIALVDTDTDRPGERGDAAFELLFTHCSRRLGVFIAQLVRDRDLADDVLQETFASAFRDRDRLGAVERPEAWLFGIARNRALDALRRNRRARATFQRLVSRAEPRVATDPAWSR